MPKQYISTICIILLSVIGEGFSTEDQLNNIRKEISEFDFTLYTDLKLSAEEIINTPFFRLLEDRVKKLVLTTHDDSKNLLKLAQYLEGGVSTICKLCSDLFDQIHGSQILQRGKNQYLNLTSMRICKAEDPEYWRMLP